MTYIDIVKNWLSLLPEQLSYCLSLKKNLNNH